MAKAKLKNVALLLLVLTNLLLLWMTIPTIGQSYRASQGTASQLAQLFSQYDVTFSPDIVPETTTLYVAELSTDQHDATPSIQAILGDTVYVEDSSTQHQQKYRSAMGYCDIARTGDFLCQLDDGPSVSDMRTYVVGLLGNMGITTTQVSQPVQQSSGIYQVTATQQLFGVPYLSSHLDFFFENGALTTISGNGILGDAQFTRSGEPAMGYKDALVVFFASRDTLGWVGTTITEITQSFSLTDTASASLLRLSPGWTITTDTGSFWVDGITRQIVAMGN